MFTSDSAAFEAVVDPIFFETPADFRAWLAENHATADQLLVGFHKMGSGRRSITWPEAVDEALCYGWIDGVRKGIDAGSYTIRFTPRRPGSVWSAKNLKRFEELQAEGRITAAGQAAFDDPKARRQQYAYERPLAELALDELEAFRANPTAWTGFQAFLT